MQFQKSIGPLCLIGIAVGTLALAYPELSAPIAVAPSIIIVWRCIRDKSLPLLSLTAGLACFAIVIAPEFGEIKHTITSAFAASTANGVRPGQGYFPTFFDPRCFCGAMLLFYAPFEPCNLSATSIISSLIAGFSILAIIFGIIRARGDLAPVALYAILVLAAVAAMLIMDRYDYGAYKLLSIVFPAFVVLGYAVCSTTMTTRALIGLPLLLSVAAIVTLRLVSLDNAVKYKSMTAFRATAAEIDPRAIVAFDLREPLAFEWAAYYFRKHKVVPLSGRLPYEPTKPLSDPQIAPFVGKATVLVTDRDNGRCLGTQIAATPAYKVMRLANPGDCLAQQDIPHRLYARPIVKVAGVSGDWITSSGLTLTVDRRQLQRFPEIVLKGDANYKWLGGEPKARAISGTNRELPVTFLAGAGTYRITIDASVLSPGDDTIKLTFDRFFVPKKLGINGDTRELVVFAPKSAQMVRR